MTSIEIVAASLQEGMNCGVRTYSASRIARSLDMAVSIVCKFLRNILFYYPYKVTNVQELIPASKSQFCSRVSCSHEWAINSTKTFSE